ncbi:MAG: T9SS type A sorting domain-containing protein [Bacteroidia bacterium]|nr:T9SS type A sorting domain-containing protein [Bacteroidia bacterium]
MNLLKNISKSLFILLTIGLFACAGYAKNYDLRIELDFPDSVYQGSTDSIEVDIKNKDTIAYSGSLYINYMVSDTIPSSVPGGLVASFTDTLLSITIGPDSSYEFMRSLYIDPAIFSTSGKTAPIPKNKVVIIWPTKFESDSNDIEFNMYTEYVFVQWPLGISNYTQNNSVIIYPNPAKDHVQFNIEGLSNNDVEVSIYDALGKLVNKIEGIKQINWNLRDDNGILVKQGSYLIQIKNPEENLIYSGKLIITY